MLSSNILRPSLLELTSVLGDSSRWIYSSVTNATRTNGLASGKFGLELAILENKNSSDWDELVNVCRSLDPFQDDCIDFVESGLSKAIADPLRLSRLIDSRVGLTRNSANRSDAFVGVVSAAWALKVAGNPTLGPKDFIEVTLPVENRFGFAHGIEGVETVNVLANTSFSPKSDRVAPKVNGGWCNGTVSSAALVRLPGGEIDFNTVRECVTQLDQIGFLSSDGLCHGKAGVLVAVMGVARLTGDVELAKRCQKTFAETFRDLPLFRSESDTYSDFSWLTGLAGIVWAHAVMLRPPLVNPICPDDRRG